MFQCLREMPRRNSIQESILILYVRKRDSIDFMKTFVSIQAAVSTQEAVKAFDAYKEAAFPWWKETKKDKDSQNIEKLLKEVTKVSAMYVRPLMSSQRKSRLVERLRR